MSKSDIIVVFGVLNNVTARMEESGRRYEAKMKAKQRECIKFGDLVMEGRDIGSNVFPDTDFKFYLDASLDERSKRRAADGVDENLAERDKQDSQRAAAPLMIPLGAKVINNSEMTAEETSACGRLRCFFCDGAAPEGVCSSALRTTCTPPLSRSEGLQSFRSDTGGADRDGALSAVRMPIFIDRGFFWKRSPRLP